MKLISILWIYLFLKDFFFLDNWKIQHFCFQKEENKYMCITATSGHQQQTINNFIPGELSRYVRFNTLEKNFIKLKGNFSLGWETEDTKKLTFQDSLEKLNLGLETNFLWFLQIMKIIGKLWCDSGQCGQTYVSNDIFWWRNPNGN